MILDAVNRVNTGATVHITAGTYAEQVVIDRDITLQTSGAVTLQGSGGDGITIAGRKVHVLRADPGPEIFDRDFALGSPVGGGAKSSFAGGPSSSVKRGFNASAHI